MADITGPVYAQLQAQFNSLPNPQPIDGVLQAVCIDTVDQLLQGSTVNEKPGMLLGKIQSGKTRAFIGVLALALDNGYDHVVIFTKGTKALARQTVARLRRDLKLAIDQELVNIYDIINLPDTLSPWELERKLILVCKKEDDNMLHLTEVLTQNYPELAEKKILLIDDEADLASIGYKRGPDGIDANVIPTQMNDLRESLTNASYLMVTATPYALYLQPEGEIEIPSDRAIFKPIRPAFTKLVPVHDAYIGGEFYFEESQNPSSVAWFLHVPVAATELVVLKKANTSILSDVLGNADIASIRRAIVTFIVGGTIRRWQQQQAGTPPKRYSFIVHTETSNAAHNWQNTIVTSIIDRLRAEAAANLTNITTLITDAYNDLQQSIAMAGIHLPALTDILPLIPSALNGAQPQTVNKESDVDQLLDENGQLQLRNPLNIFIGGNILDRGITIDNVIGFYYGRNPKKSQQDTVLQHARMYGARAEDDLAVTRFYTTNDIYDRMDRIHQFDSALRTALEQGGHDHGVIFLHKDASNEIAPCSPNKILLSHLTTLKSGGRLIPYGFATTMFAPGSKAAIDQILASVNPDSGNSVYILTLDQAEQVIDHIDHALEMDYGRDFDFLAMKAAARYLATNNEEPGETGQVACLVRRGRSIPKLRNNGRYQNAPERQSDQDAIQSSRGSRPVLLLFGVVGAQADGWDGQDFFWPVLVSPAGIQPVIFTAETGD